MRRWNGWGEETTSVALAPSARQALERLVGPGTPPDDARLEAVVRAVPESRLPSHPLVSTEPLDRVRHARGQSLPDWIALRSGRLEAFPDGVARPASAGEVRTLLAWAGEVGAAVVPYGGGTGVVGATAPEAGPGARPTLTIALERLAGLEALDERSGLATFGAGVAGPALEAALEPHGWRLGHYPQSWEGSTLGGWVATRSSGQQSLGYGRIEALFAGGRVEAPAGTLELPPHPASATGPDLRAAILGSEGRLGILTSATVRLAPLPELETTVARFLPDLDRGIEVVRALARSRLPLAMVRLSTAEETTTTLQLAGKPRATRLLERLLRLRGLGPERCLLLVGVAGSRRVAGSALREALAIAREGGAAASPGDLGGRWSHERFRSPYLRNALWEAGYAVDTLETAVPWASAPALLAELDATLRAGLAPIGERVHAFTHLSHVYPTGTSLYTTYLFRLAADPDETRRRWATLKGAASRAIVARGGTITHQHGVGRDHAPYLPAEKGPLGMAALEALARTFDPDAILAPGVLLPR